MALTVSTIGMMRKARRREMRYALMSMWAKPKRFERKSTSTTAVVKSSDAAIARYSALLWLPERSILTDEPRCERILNEWKISHMDIVKNAIVIPSALS